MKNPTHRKKTKTRIKTRTRKVGGILFNRMRGLLNNMRGKYTREEILNMIDKKELYLQGKIKRTKTKLSKHDITAQKTRYY